VTFQISNLQRSSVWLLPLPTPPVRRGRKER
jgi:hypothetical protein